MNFGKYVMIFLNHQKAPTSHRSHRLLPVHALVEVLKLQPTLPLGAGLPDTVAAFNPLLLECVAASRPFVGLLSALQQQPAVKAVAKARTQVHEWHDAAEGGRRGRKQ